MRSAHRRSLQHRACLRVEAVAFVAAQLDDALAAQPLQHFAHAQERQRNIQLFQLCMHAAHANAAAIAVGGVQGIDDLEADQAGTQPETAQQLADLFVADAFVSQNVPFRGRFAWDAPSLDLGLRVVHVNAPFRGRTRNLGASLTRTNENGKTAAQSQKKAWLCSRRSIAL
ncbi:protein of unknown function [Pseudomonas inefficax]|uniref:Uncharacterized protein n=1 Tax=Pseudomonas inefficax TaxID=2078786 RepID=A0AAQ1SUV0_9PSED|nr:protein of unknown function [Pseudomonas inefficax]